MVQTRSRNTEYDVGLEEDDFEDIETDVNVPIADLERTVDFNDIIHSQSDASQQKDREIESIRRQFDNAVGVPEEQCDTDSTSEHVLDCPICKVYVSSEDFGLLCERCKTWHHTACLFIGEQEYSDLSRSSVEWFCDCCSSIRANRIKWGSIEGEDNISQAVQQAYEEVIKWRKNMFMIPRGKCGSNLIKELTRLIFLFVQNKKQIRIKNKFY